MKNSSFNNSPSKNYVSKNATNSAATACLNEFWTIEDIVREKGCSRQAVGKAIREGRVAAKKKGKQWLIHKSDARRFVAA